MSVHFFSWNLRGAKPALAALALLALLSQATPSAFAAINITYNTVDALGATTPTASLGTGGSSGLQTPAGQFFTWQVTVTPLDTPGATGSSTLSTSTFTVNNTAATTDTLTINVNGTGFDAGTTGQTLFVNFAVSGTGGPTNTATDTTTGKSWINFANAATFATGTLLTPNQTIVPTATSPISATYTSGTSSTMALVEPAGSPPFSLIQQLAITLGAGDSATLTITTRALTTPQAVVPEPSSLAIAGIGALGLIGFGLRRRKALGA